MQTPLVFQYKDARLFLQDWLSTLQKEDPSYSVRRWAREMELSHALLVMLLQGKRPLRLKHTPALTKGMTLSTSERIYLQALIEFNSAGTETEKRAVSNLLSELNPGMDFRIKELEEFETISNWIHMAILAFTKLKAYDGKIESIQKRFKSRKSIHEIRSAVSRLISTGLLSEDKNGRLLPTYSHVTTKDDVSIRGGREYHRQVSILASEAIHTQDPLEREFQSFALPVDPKKIPEVKEMFRKFRTQLTQLLTEGEGSEVYQTNLQFFRLTERSPVTVTVEDEGVDNEVQSKPSGELYV